MTSKNLILETNELKDSSDFDRWLIWMEISLKFERILKKLTRFQWVVGLSIMMFKFTFNNIFCIFEHRLFVSFFGTFLNVFLASTTFFFFFSLFCNLEPMCHQSTSSSSRWAIRCCIRWLNWSNIFPYLVFLRPYIQAYI